MNFKNDTEPNERQVYLTTNDAFLLICLRLNETKVEQYIWMIKSHLERVMMGVTLIRGEKETEFWKVCLCIGPGVGIPHSSSVTGMPFSLGQGTSPPSLSFLFCEMGTLRVQRPGVRR